MSFTLPIAKKMNDSPLRMGTIYIGQNPENESKTGHSDPLKKPEEAVKKGVFKNLDKEHD